MPLGAFAKQVNASLVDPAFIVKVRKKLDLDQRQAAEISELSVALAKESLKPVQDQVTKNFASLSKVA